MTSGVEQSLLLWDALTKTVKQLRRNQRRPIDGEPKQLRHVSFHYEWIRDAFARAASHVNAALPRAAVIEGIFVNQIDRVVTVSFRPPLSHEKVPIESGEPIARGSFV